LLGNLGEGFVENYTAIPLDPFSAFTGIAVFPRLRGGNRKLHNLASILGDPDLWVSAKMAD